MLEYLQFSTKYIKWIMSCVSSVSYSILFNSEAIEPFSGAKVLRQGDTIPTYLFVIAMEYLSRLLDELK